MGVYIVENLIRWYHSIRFLCDTVTLGYKNTCIQGTVESLISMSQPSIIWLTFDSLRADRTSVHGHSRETTPNLNKLSQRDLGNKIDSCFSHGIWSLPSVASILTGRYPIEHGVGIKNDVLPTEITTVPEVLSSEGWETVGLSMNSFFQKDRNLDKGFDQFVEVTPANPFSDLSMRDILSFIKNVRTYSGGLKLDRQKHNLDYIGFLHLQKIIKQMKSDKKPYFISAHFQGVHHPYYPSPEFNSAFPSGGVSTSDEQRSFSFNKSTNIYSEIAHMCPYSRHRMGTHPSHI